MEIVRLIPSEARASVKLQFSHPGARSKVNLFQLNPHETGTGGIFKKVDKILLVGDRTPDCASNIWLVGSADSSRYANVSQHAELHQTIYSNPKARPTLANEVVRESVASRW